MIDRATRVNLHYIPGQGRKVVEKCDGSSCYATRLVVGRSPLQPMGTPVDLPAAVEVAHRTSEGV